MEPQPHVRVNREYRIPRLSEMPARIKRQVHDCGTYKWDPKSTRDNPPIKCANCRKVVPWFVFKCVKCEKHFIKDFRHPKFCPLYPTCWEDTLSLEWITCIEHVPDDEFHSEIVEPTGANPAPLVIDKENDPVFAFLRT